MKRFKLKIINDKMWLINDSEGPDITTLQECVNMLNELHDKNVQLDQLNADFLAKNIESLEMFEERFQKAKMFKERWLECANKEEDK